MKRLPLMIMVISVGLLTACGTGAGELGPAPTGPASSASPAAPARSQPASTAQPPSESQAPARTATPVPAATPSGGTTRQVVLQTWFTRQGKLFVTERIVPATAGVGRAALDRLLAGPSAAEYAAGVRSQIPAGTRLLGLRIAAGTATADFTPSFVSAASPSTMPLRIAQVVYTLAQFPSVTGVRFAINGQGVTVIGGVPVQGPQTPAMYDGYLPAIIVRSPVIGEQVTGPVTVSGTADVFEAVVSVRILDSAGGEVARTFTTASCGTGCRGDYSVAVSYTVPREEPGTIEVFESSAKDGQPVNVQLIPVTLAP
jgi:Immunoglobulin-like domain of bacterial spore germination/Sporulation and spore germination